MIAVIVIVVVVVLAAAAVAWAYRGRIATSLGSRGSSTPQKPADFPAGAERILFPYGAGGPTASALDVALRLARAESGTLVPVFLARVSLHLPLDAPLPRTSKLVVPLQDLIEQRAITYGVPVDQRIERGRSYRHAMRETIAHERFDRIVVAAAGAGGRGGFEPDDVAWLLRNAPGEIVVLRPRQAAPLDNNGHAPPNNGHAPPDNGHAPPNNGH
jgi:nucleotide-binding universal stress UspA family protein